MEQEAARSATLGMLMSGKARCLRPALGEWAGGEGGVGGERRGRGEWEGEGRGEGGGGGEEAAPRSAALGMLMSGKARCLRPALGDWAGGEGGSGRGSGREEEREAGGSGSPLSSARHADEREGTLSAAGSR